MEYRYFVSYKSMLNGVINDGNVEVKTDRRIRYYRDIGKIEKHLTKKYKREGFVINNYILI